MAKVCSVCSLPKDLLADVEAKLGSGVTYRAVAEWLAGRGQDITVAMLSNHKARHTPLTQAEKICSTSQSQPYHVETEMSSAELIRANIRDAIALSQQLQLANQPMNLRVSRVLVEHLANLHRMLTDVAFEGDSDAG